MNDVPNDRASKRAYRATIPHALMVLALASQIVAPAAKADPIEDFYKGKTLTIMVGQEPGTGFDIYSRALARHIGRYIPGNPAVIVQNMAGASGVVSFNWLYNVAQKDGTVIGTSSQNVAVEGLFGNAAAKYDATKLNWIGNMEESAAVCGVTPEANVSKFDELLTREIVVGATGPTGPIGQAARALNGVVGTKFKITYGYKGTASIKLAMASGEVKGICGLPWSTIKSFWKDELDAKRFKPIIQLSARRSPELGDIAHIDDYVKTDEQRQVVELIFGQLALGRIYAAPPGVPAERLTALRTSFMSTLADKEFLADAEKTRIDIIPTTGAQVEALVKRFYAVPKSVVDLAKKTIEPK